MLNIRQYITYAAIIIVSASIGATLSHYYSSKVIDSLQEEIDNEKKNSIESIKNHMIELDTLNSVSTRILSKNEKLKNQIDAERAKRVNYKIDTSKIVKITNDHDSILNYFRIKLNKD